MNYLEQYLEKELIIQYNSVDEFEELMNFFISKNISIFDVNYKTLESLNKLANCHLVDFDKKNNILYSKKDKFVFIRNNDDIYWH